MKLEMIQSISVCVLVMSTLFFAFFTCTRQMESEQRLDVIEAKLRTQSNTMTVVPYTDAHIVHGYGGGSQPPSDSNTGYGGGTEMPGLGHGGGNKK